MLPTLSKLQASLAARRTSSLELTQQALARAQDPHGQGRLVFTRIYQERALAAARASDALRAAGIVRSPLEGLPISVKDLFDVAGEPTLAGSVVLDKAPAATADAVVVQRLIDAGAIITGKTNMVEFAFSGLGLNPHYGTPCSPWDRDAKRIPGGSSSGAGVAVAEGMSVLSIGSDTGGSVRIPSAFCGLTGFKPTARRVPTQGAIPLSSTLDSIGGLAASVQCCGTIDAILSGEFWLNPDSARQAGELRHLSHLRLAVPKDLVLDEADATVLEAFHRALELIAKAGVQIETIAIPEFQQLSTLNAKGGFTGAEAWAWHKDLLGSAADRYDPRVASRIIRCKDMTAADYIELIHARRAWIESVDEKTQEFDALLMPTVPIVAPPIKDLEASDDLYFATNRVVLRNPTLINFWDGCAVSLPCHRPGEAPVGLMVAGRALQDHHILQTAATLEALLQPVTDQHEPNRA